jgi:ribosomal protein S6
MENEKENKGEEDSLFQIYELSYLVNPTKSSEEAEKTISNIKSRILEKGGSLLTEGKSKVIDLAYPMAKVISNKRHVYENAYFGWIKMELAREKLAAFKEMLEKESDIIRFLLIKTKKDVPQVKRRQIRKPLVTKEEPPKNAPAVDEEKLNKELEEILTA